MEILDIPSQFQPKCNNKFPVYSLKLTLEEIFYKYFIKNPKKIISNRIYIPIFWTNYIVTRNYGRNNEELENFLNKTLEKNKKYFTIIQNASGVYYKNKKNINILIFSSGGGGFSYSREKGSSSVASTITSENSALKVLLT